MDTRSFLALTPHGFHRIAYTSWGTPASQRTLICVHGLTRNSRDFDTLAAALSPHYRVICPDMPGRGESPSFTHAEDYQYPVYLQICAALIAHLNVEKVAWLGTSMGGLIGMMLAAQPRTPIAQLILNDVGAVVPGSALRRIGEYVGQTGPFADLDALEAHLRTVHAPFGSMSNAQWRHMAQHSYWRDEERRYWLAYDPRIGETFRDMDTADIDLWPVWRQVCCPTLLLRGAESDVLLAETAVEMSNRHNCEVYTFPDVGHAPPLVNAKEVELIDSWLRLNVG